MWRSACLGAAAVLLFLLMGFDTFSRPAGGGAPAAPRSTAASTAALHEEGRAVYNFRCYFCHGYSGDARTLATSYLSPPPRDFTRSQLSAAQVAQAVQQGRPGTAMKSFHGVISAREIEAVAHFVAAEFVRDKATNTTYHTAANGWPGHQRHAAAFPFARGELALDTPLAQLNDGQRAGRQLFLTSCISCHDRAKVIDEGPAWSSRPVSYPRMGFVPGQPNTPPVDAVSSASVYAKHEVVPVVAGLTRQQQRGQALFQANCSFCHGGDGTGKNWIGQFMEPKARDLTQYTVAQMPPALLKQRIREGLPGTSMPAWQQVLSPAEVDAVAAYVVRVFFAQPTVAAGAPPAQAPARP
jgi:cytochrome c oxidase cbb3-type subunit III